MKSPRQEVGQGSGDLIRTLVLRSQEGELKESKEIRYGRGQICEDALISEV